MVNILSLFENALTRESVQVGKTPSLMFDMISDIVYCAKSELQTLKYVTV